MKKIISFVFVAGILFTVLPSVSKAQSIMFTYDNAGNRVSRTDPAGKKETGIKDTTNNLSVTVFPNPTSGKLSIAIDNQASNSVAMVNVFDLSGKTVLQQQMTTATMDIDLSTQPDGVYEVRLISGKNSKTWKVLKQ